MKVITWIKIRNFRSFLNIKNEINNLKDFNIFSWANDSWKSNIFRALNLFFNNEISYWKKFNIDDDFSRNFQWKTKKVIEISLKFDQWIWSTYLPKEFEIKKIYYRNNDFKYNYIFENNWKIINISSIPEENTESDEKKYRTQFSKFLLSFHFEYVPAIRDERYFWNIFKKIIVKIRDAELYKLEKIDEKLVSLCKYKDTIDDNNKLIKKRKDKILNELKKWIKWKYNISDLKRYVNWINKYINENNFLKNKINREHEINKLNNEKSIASDFSKWIKEFSLNLNKLSLWLFSEISFLKSEFTVQNDLLNFFEIFEIWTWDNKDISLKFRWDWMQSKFIPHILDFLAKKQIWKDDNTFEWEYDTKWNYLWWFEEPENSYEYSNSIRLSNNFVWIENIKKDEYWNYVKNNEWEYEKENLNYSRNKQIFITTHSEEFLRLFEEKLDIWISMYLIQKEFSKDNKISYSTIDEIKKEELEKVHYKLWLNWDKLENISRSKLIFDIKKSLHERNITKEQIENLLNENKSLKDHNITLEKEKILLNSKIEELKKENKKIVLCENLNAELFNSLWFEWLDFKWYQDKNNVFYYSNSLWEFGLIDKDYLFNSEVEFIEKETKVKVLKYYSIENYLFHPNNLFEYHSYNWNDFNIEKYMESIITEFKDNIFNPSSITDWRKSYWKIKEFLKNNWITNVKQLVLLYNSEDFEEIYEYLPMKDNCTELEWRKNINPKELAKTKWFKKQMEEILKDILLKDTPN